MSDGTHTADIALLSNYIASSFVAASNGLEGTIITEAMPITAAPTAFLSQPMHS